MSNLFTFNPSTFSPSAGRSRSSSNSSGGRCSPGNAGSEGFNFGCSGSCDPAFRSMMALPLDFEQQVTSAPVTQIDSIKFLENPSMKPTPVTIPPRPRSLAPTVIRCLYAFMELKLSIDYFLDVICEASFQFIRDRCNWVGVLYRGSYHCQFTLNVYQEEMGTHLIEFLMVQGESNLFYAMYNSLRDYMNQTTARNVIPESGGGPLLSQIEDNLLPPPPPSVSTSEEVSQGISSLRSLFISPDPTMRIEGLKALVDLLNPHEDGSFGDNSRLLIEGLYRTGVTEYLSERLHRLLNDCLSGTGVFHWQGSTSSFETHLLMISLGRVVQSKIIQDEIFFNPTLLCTLHSFASEPKAFAESKHTAEYILQELAKRSPERAVAIMGQYIFAKYLPVNTPYPAQQEGKIVRNHSRSPPLSCGST